MHGMKIIKKLKNNFRLTDKSRVGRSCRYSNYAMGLMTEDSFDPGKDKNYIFSHASRPLLWLSQLPSYRILDSAPYR
jgi:hypothetical protein